VVSPDIKSGAGEDYLTVGESEETEFVHDIVGLCSERRSKILEKDILVIFEMSMPILEVLGSTCDHDGVTTGFGKVHLSDHKENSVQVVGTLELWHLRVSNSPVSFMPDAQGTNGLRRSIKVLLDESSGDGFWVVY